MLVLVPSEFTGRGARVSRLVTVLPRPRVDSTQPIETGHPRGVMPPACQLASSLSQGRTGEAAFLAVCVDMASSYSMGLL